MRPILIVLQALLCIAIQSSWANPAAESGRRQEGNAVFARRASQLEQSIESSIETMKRLSLAGSELEQATCEAAIADILAELAELGEMEAKKAGRFGPSDIKASRLRSLDETREQVCDDDELRRLCDAIHQEMAASST